MGKKLTTTALVLMLALTCLLVWAMPAAAIQYGQPDGENHPYVCLLTFHDEHGEPLWFCTGVLLSPTVVLTAAHATDGAYAAKAWFWPELPEGSGFPYDGPDSHPGQPYTNPGFMIGAAPGMPSFDYHDVGVVVLDEPVAAATYGRLPEAGVVDGLPAMHPVDLVGYGVNYQARGGGVSPYDAWVWLVARYYAPSLIVQAASVTGSEFLQLTANPARGKGGITFGDSGGPVFDSGTNLVLGVNSFVNNSNCRGVTYSQRIDIPDILQWIEGFLE
jgi:hypothetical protein